MNRPRILLADDHALMLENISSILAPHYEIVETVADGLALVEAALRLKPDLIVTDISMPLLSGLQAAVQIKKSLPDVRLLFVTMSATSVYAKVALSVGGTGYVLKSTMREELLDAVESVLNGRIYLSPSISTQHADLFQGLAAMDPGTARILKGHLHPHIVYPYGDSDDRSLVSKVGYYASSGLGRNGAVILVTTEAHRTAIKKYLKADWNVEALEARGQLCFLDAAETLDRFMANDRPDPVLFETCFRPAIEHAQRDERTGLKREVWFFGEMVDLLWPGNGAAAERLEELWNKMVKEYSIRILCAYSVGGPCRGPLSEALIKAHTHVVS
jgi:DNA-binding NarL/FixJ family response regulator